MYERMLNKQEVPEIADLTAYCGKAAEWFTLLNEWLTQTYGTVQQISFPYGNRYGWGIAHRVRQKLICRIFAEHNAFTVMVRLSDRQFASVYEQVQKHTQEQIDNKYPCGSGGWLHYRVTQQENFDDIQKILSAKCC